MDFGEILKDLRESHNFTQEQLAEQLDVSRSTIAGYESRNRQPDFEKLLAISRFFQVSVDYLLTGTTEQEFTLIPKLNEKLLDKKVIKAYRDLSTDGKLAVLNYIELLLYKENTNHEGD